MIQDAKQAVKKAAMLGFVKPLAHSGVHTKLQALGFGKYFKADEAMRKSTEGANAVVLAELRKSTLRYSHNDGSADNQGSLEVLMSP